MRRTLLLTLLLAAGAALAAETPAPRDAAKDEKPAAAAPDKTPDKAPDRKDEGKAGDEGKPKGDDGNLGMSILGNQEAPKSLVIVPWKGSEIGNSLGISTLLDDSRQPIDKEVFMRALSYYELRSTTTTTTTTHRRKS